MIDIIKTYRTRDGCEVRIYATDGGGDHPVHGAVKDGDIWVAYSWLPNGKIYGHTPQWNDLIEVKPRIRREVWINMYPEWLSNDMAWPSKQEADEGAAPDRIACVRLTIDCEEGEGL